MSQTSKREQEAGVPLPLSECSLERVPLCPVCQTDVSEEGGKVTCAECKSVYHLECWQDNFGCATFGCKNTNVLKPEPIRITIPSAEPVAQPVAGVPWEHVFLGLATLSTFIGLAFHGIPPLLVGLAAGGFYVIKQEQIQSPLVLKLAVASSVVGFLLGAILS